jgi:glycosyltransferase involved in cell wall biosynthesis
MNIALLSYEYPLETGFGGIGTYTWYQARALAKLGHKVYVLAGSLNSTQIRKEEHDGVTVYRYRSDGLLMRCFQLFGNLDYWWTKNRLENALSMYKGVRILLQRHNIDIIEMPECGGEGFLINNLIGARTIIKLHSPAKLIMPYYSVPKTDITLCSLIEHLGMRKANAFSSCSRFLAEQARNKLAINKPIRIIPNGIDIELLDNCEKTDIYRKFGIPRDRLTILFSGRMEFRKGIHLCKEIVPPILERYDVNFIFAGQDLFNYMSEILMPHLKGKKLKGSVYYLGKLNQSEVYSCLSEADIFLIPSLWENFPYSCLEAMAAGCAIVGSDHGGMPELIKDCQNGLLARNSDPCAYIESLQRLIEDRNFRESLGSAARKTIENSYTDTHIAKMSIQFYEECINQC